jgi:hypothetical protein
MVKRDPELRGDRFEIRVVANDEWDVGRELSGPLPQEQIVQAVVILRDEDRHSRSPLAVRESPAHSETVGDFPNGRLEAGPVGMQLREVELDALEKLAGNWVRVLVSVEDVRTWP